MKSISLFRLNGLLLFVVLSCTILYYGRSFLVPLFFAILLSMLLLPVCSKLESRGFSRVMSTLAGISMIVLFFSLIIVILIIQGIDLSENIPHLQEVVTAYLDSLQRWIENRYGVSSNEQSEYLKGIVRNLSESGGVFFGNIMSSTINLVSGLALILVYFFFIMWKREKYKEFIIQLTGPQNREEVTHKLEKITHVSGQYLIGRFISMCFLTVVYILGFFMIGLPNAFLMALLAVIPTIIPYLGSFVGGFFPLAFSLVSTPETFWPVAILLIAAQVFDNNIIEPLAEGESMDISPAFTIVALVLGNLLWGVAGMILFIPLFAILKIVCDHIPELQPVSYLLTNEIQDTPWLRTIRKFLKL